jgi:hypothetical protein
MNKLQGPRGSALWFSQENFPTKAIRMASVISPPPPSFRLAVYKPHFRLMASCEGEQGGGGGGGARGAPLRSKPNGTGNQLPSAYQPQRICAQPKQVPGAKIAERRQPAPVSALRVRLPHAPHLLLVMGERCNHWVRLEHSRRKLSVALQGSRMGRPPTSCPCGHRHLLLGLGPWGSPRRGAGAVFGEKARLILIE